MRNDVRAKNWRIVLILGAIALGIFVFTVLSHFK